MLDRSLYTGFNAGRQARLSHPASLYTSGMTRQALRLLRLILRLLWDLALLCWHLVLMARRPWQFLLDDAYRRKVLKSWRYRPTKRYTQLFLGAAVLVASIPAAWYLLWVGAQLFLLMPGI